LQLTREAPPIWHHRARQRDSYEPPHFSAAESGSPAAALFLLGRDSSGAPLFPGGGLL